MPREGQPRPGEHGPKPRLVYEITDAEWKPGKAPGTANMDGIIQSGWVNPGFPNERVTLEQAPPADAETPEVKILSFDEMHEAMMPIAQQQAETLARKEGRDQPTTKEIELICGILTVRAMELQRGGIPHPLDAYGPYQQNIMERLGWLDSQT